MAKEIDDLRMLLANQSRDWRRLDEENQQLKTLTADLREEVDARVRQQFIETTKLHRRLNDAVDTSGRVADAFLALLRRLHPRASPDTIKRLAQDEVNAVRVHHSHRGAAIEFLGQRRQEPVEMPRWTQTPG